MKGLQKNSPPFGKGRTAGIYEPPFQKTKLIPKIEYKFLELILKNKLLRLNPPLQRGEY